MLEKIAARLAGHAFNALPVADFHAETRAWPTRKTEWMRLQEELRAAVGEANVSADKDALRRLARTTLIEGTLPAVAVKPVCVSEIQAVLKIAAKYKLPVHPLSCGKNWGYGDACAVTDGQIILDLKRMNRILEVNAELGYAVVEPGVTQGQMAEYLAENKLPWWTDATGAGPDASIVGNTVERGFGHTPNGDRFQNSCGMEIVLPDGRLLKTGFGHYANARAAGCFKWGLGPYLDGLFTQSNFGIVTKLTYWLVPKPECFQAFFFIFKNEADIGALVEALRPLRLNGTLKTAVHIFNDLRLLCGAEEFPWRQYDGREALPPAVVARMVKKHGLGAWSGSGALYGSKEEVRAAARVIKKTLRRVPGLKMLFFCDDRRLRLAELGVGLLRRLGLGKSLVKLTAKLRLGYELLQGRSSAETLRGSLWRVRRPLGTNVSESANPLDHDAGFYWLSPVVPLTKAEVERFHGVVKPLFAKHGFEYQATLSLVTGRALCAVTTISFDKRNKEESARAKRCHDELWEAVVKAGYVPYRAGNGAMGKLDDTSSVFWDVTAQLKQALDPQGLISPGHYDPAGARR